MEAPMKILIANDHGAVELKARVAEYLRSKGHEVENLGVDSPDSVDYPDMAKLAADRFLAGGFDFGVLCCGTGVGISIAANKVPGIRCAQVFDLFTADMCKRHNDANFISFGGRITYRDSVESMIERYMATEFEGGRHAVRVGKIDAML
jgi:ribose 5-phosphate isomerase B